MRALKKKERKKPESPVEHCSLIKGTLRETMCRPEKILAFFCPPPKTN